MKSNDINQQLDFLLHAASRHLTRLYKSYLDPFDLTYTQYLVFLCLDHHLGMTVEAIGEKLYLDSGTLTPLLKRLEAKKYIVRLRSLEDERKLEIKLTSEGQNLQQELKDIPNALFTSLGLASDSLGSINQLLLKLISLFQHKNKVKAA